MRMANVPFVGADVLSSAVCMDKDVMKRLARDAGIPIAKFVTVHRREVAKLNFDKVIKQVGLPCFVKPANLGSSIGICKVKHAADLKTAIEQALAYDNKVVIEEFIEGREFECGVLGNDEPIASVPGEVIPHHEFYTYEAKYLDPAGAEIIAQADLPADLVKKVQDLSIKVFRAFDCDGMARVDFFLKKDGTFIFNELNTIPGFTQISQYPKMWEASGIPYAELLDKLITLALEKFDQRQNLKLSPTA
jgi:D-alanine-D-alanine ligase